MMFVRMFAINAFILSICFVGIYLYIYIYMCVCGGGGDFLSVPFVYRDKHTPMHC